MKVLTKQVQLYKLRHKIKYETRLVDSVISSHILKLNNT